MGSRKVRLHNEAVRRQQAAVDAAERINQRNVMAASVKDILKADHEYQQVVSREEYERLNACRQQRKAVEAERKQAAYKELKDRKAEMDGLARETQGLLIEFHAVQAATSSVLQQALKSYTVGIHQEMDCLLKTFDAERQASEREQQQYLASFVGELKVQDTERRNLAQVDTCGRLEYLFDLLDLDLREKNKPHRDEQAG